MSNIRDRIKGSIPALVTPFKNGKVDEAAYRKLGIAWQIAEGTSRAGSLRHHRRIAHPEP